MNFLLRLFKKPPVIPVIPELEPTNVMWQAFGNHGNFWDEIKDPAVTTPLQLLLSTIPPSHWQQRRIGSRVTGVVEFYLELGNRWEVAISDEDLEFYDLEFRYCGKRLFTVHRHCPWKTFQARHVLGPIFKEQLTDLITSKVAEYHRLTKEKKTRFVYAP